MIVLGNKFSFCLFIKLLTLLQVSFRTLIKKLIEIQIIYVFQQDNQNVNV